MDRDDPSSSKTVEQPSGSVRTNGWGDQDSGQGRGFRGGRGGFGPGGIAGLNDTTADPALDPFAGIDGFAT